MIVTPLAAESLGVRSVATYVECGQTRVLIDPGAILAPSRFNLPPVEEEWEALRRANDRISTYATRASLIFITHYHEDHFRHDPEGRGPVARGAGAYRGGRGPTLLSLWGPPAYLESQLGAELVDRGIEHLLRIIDQTGCRVILDHHALRDAAYPERFSRLWETGRVVTAAGYLGEHDAPLEARRRELWTVRGKPPMPARPPRARAAGGGPGGGGARGKTS